ncbi:CpaF family protein [Benzoatithermus flavus]|uniref:CpaF family protein n=1 Tax=Benzoatithermus flavus TaxID=3108223 RepID=A0ABU8XR30_9PROT
MFGRKVTLPQVERVESPGAAGRATQPPPDQEEIFRAHFRRIRERLIARINVSAAVLTGRERLARYLGAVVAEIAGAERLRMTAEEQERVVGLLLDDMFGLGPIEPLLADETVTDILINGPNQVYVERHGLLELTNVTFQDEDHVVNIAQRIASSVGRRVDETSPMVDARLADGSRVNIVLPPLALDGACISIRKFARTRIDLAAMVQNGSLSLGMGRLLAIAGRCRLNIVISGGTGSGKTTLLNALSQMIDRRERIITIEDAAELQLQQPHVVRLETRPPSIEGIGEINQRELVRNALRMRPDRIILGETRGAEAFDVLQAMNTGHDGSMTTIHANSPRDALVRLENMVVAASPNLPLRAIRSQIVSAIHLIVQVARMRDGKRRVLAITEITGLEGDVIATQDLFHFVYDDNESSDEVRGRYVCNRIRPRFAEKARYYGLEDELMACMA